MSSFSFDVTLMNTEEAAMRHLRLMSSTGIEDCCGTGYMI